MLNRRAVLATAGTVGPAMLFGGAFAATSDEELVRQYYMKLLSEPDAPDIMERVRMVVSEDWKATPRPIGGTGAVGFAKTLRLLAEIVPDLSWEPVEVLSCGNRWVVRGRAIGTPVKPFLGVEQPTGHSFDIMSIDMHTIKEGRISRTYHVEEWMSAMRQIMGD